MMPHTPRLQDQTIVQLEARRDQLESDLCQLHLDELGAAQVGDDAGAEEATALMRTIEAELAELATAIAAREAEIARVRSDCGPFSVPHPPNPPIGRRSDRPHNAPPSERRPGQAEEQAEEQAEPPAVEPPSAADAAWVDYTTARRTVWSLPHNAPPSERRRAEEQVSRALEALRAAEEREQLRRGS